MSLLNQYFTPKPFWFKPLSSSFACSWNSCKWIYIVCIFRERDLLSSTYHTVFFFFYNNVIYWITVIQLKLTINQLCVCVHSVSCVWLFATPRTVAHQALLSRGFSRQAYWSGLPFPTPYHTVLKSMHVFVYVSIQPMGSVVIESVLSSQVSKKKQNYHDWSAF